jgi:hypothetical protein
MRAVESRIFFPLERAGLSRAAVRRDESDDCRRFGTARHPTISCNQLRDSTVNAWCTDSVQGVLKTETPSSPENLQPVAQRISNPRNARKSLKNYAAGFSDTKFVNFRR